MDRRTFLSWSGAAAAATTVPSAKAASDTHGVRRIAPPPATTASSFPNVVLRTQDGKAVKFYDDLVKGKIFLINMFYVACTDGQCPLVTANLTRIQTLLGKRLGHDTFMYSISLDPAKDTPESLRAYAAHFNVRPGWLFLTADKPDDIEQLRRALGYSDPDPVVDAKKTTHTGLALMGNEPLDRYVFCPTLAEPSELKRVLGYLDWPKGWRKKGYRQG